MLDEDAGQQQFDDESVPKSVGIWILRNFRLEYAGELTTPQIGARLQPRRFAPHKHAASGRSDRSPGIPAITGVDTRVFRGARSGRQAWYPLFAG